MDAIDPWCTRPFFTEINIGIKRGPTLGVDVPDLLGATSSALGKNGSKNARLERGGSLPIYPYVINLNFSHLLIPLQRPEAARLRSYFVMEKLRRLNCNTAIFFLELDSLYFSLRLAVKDLSRCRLL